MTGTFSIIVPAKNEEKGLANILPLVSRHYPEAEVIVVDDASSDDTPQVALQHGCRLIRHPYSKGNGAAIKTGIMAAKHEIIVCMDADGQHQPEEISKLISMLNEDYDMVVGARDKKGQAGLHRSFANGFYNIFASWMVGQEVKDLTSGFRAVRAEKFKEFITLLPNKFSYPTTITMSFFRAGYSVGYVPIKALPRAAGTKSHINITKDGIRFLIIIFKIGTLFSPLKVFAPISLGLFITGISYYIYTFLGDGRFTNMGVLLFTTSIIVFLMGLISEQITALLYKK